MPSVILPVCPDSVIVALRKKMDLRMGVLKETTASRIVAMRVTRKPGVAGRMMPMADSSDDGQKEESDRYGGRKKVR